MEKQTITLAPPIDGVQYGINQEKIKQGDYVLVDGSIFPVLNGEFDETLDYPKILFSTNPKDTRFPYLVMPSKEQEALIFANTINPKQDEYSHGRWYGRIEGFNANPAKYTKEDIMTWYKHVKTHTCQEAFEHLDKSLQPTAKAVRVEMEAIYLRTEGEGHSSNSYGIYEDRIKVETSSEFKQGIVRAIEVIF